MFSPDRKAFQACLVPNVTNVPGIPGPYFYQSSRHTLSPLLSMFQTYLVPIITDVPCIPSPTLYKKIGPRELILRNGSIFPECHASES